MDKVHCRDNRLSSPARINLWHTALVWTVGALCLVLWTNAQAATANAQSKPVSNQQCPALLNHQFPRLQDEKMRSMCDFNGQVLLVVNTASFCGFTDQYNELEKVHSQFNAKGFSVIGFPSGDFGNQEYKSNKEIADFCHNTFGVKFPMFAKTVVKGESANSFYKQLAQASGEQPGWNFHKYLIDRQGKVVGSFNSNVSPTSPELVQAIRRALDAHPITKQ